MSNPRKRSRSDEPESSNSKTSNDDKSNEECSQIQKQLSEISIHSLDECAEITRRNNLNSCAIKIPCLDGKYFKVNLPVSKIDGTIIAECQLCQSKKEIKGTLRATSNFTTHLRRIHEKEYSKYKKYCREKRASASISVDRKSWKCAFDQKQFEENITNFSLKFFIPFSAVEDPTFRKIFDDFKFKRGNQTLKHLTRHTLGKKMNETFQALLNEIRREMNSVINNGSFICTTADVWTASSRRYLGVTASWIHPTTLERKSAAIACKRFSGTHSYDAVASLLLDIHSSFGLTPDSIRTTVTDNASNFIKAFKEFGIEFSSVEILNIDVASNQGPDGNQSGVVNDSSGVSGENVSDYVAENNLTKRNRVNVDNSDDDDGDDDDHDNNDEDNNNNNNDDDDDDDSDNNEVAYDFHLYEENLDNIEEIVEIDNDFGNQKGILPKHSRCASHTLNLIASTDLLKAINTNCRLKSKHFATMNKCSALWKSLRSPKINENLKTTLGIALKRPVVTRWNSTFDSIQQLIKVKEQLLNNNIVKIAKPFNSGDFKYLEEFLSCTAPLARAIDQLQADNCYYGILLPALLSLKKQLSSLLSSEDVTYCKPLVEQIINSVDKRFETILNFNDNFNAAIAALSCPKYKTRWLAACHPKQQEKICEAFERAVFRESSLFEDQTENNPPIFDDGFEFGDTPIIEPYQPSLSQGETKAEVTRFLKSKNFKLEVLDQFPFIKNTFIKYNTPLPSSASVERLFSFATMLNLPKYNRLTDKHFEQRLVLKANATKRYL